MERGLRGVPLQPIGGTETQREARAGSGVTFQFLVPRGLSPPSFWPSPACCLKGSCVTPTGSSPALAKMPLGHSAGSTRSEDGSEAFLEGMGNSYSLAFFHSFFSSVPQVPGTVLQHTEDRETFQGSPLGRRTHAWEWRWSRPEG